MTSRETTHPDAGLLNGMQAHAVNRIAPSHDLGVNDVFVAHQPLKPSDGTSGAAISLTWLAPQRSLTPLVQGDLCCLEHESDNGVLRPSRRNPPLQLPPDALDHGAHPKPVVPAPRPHLMAPPRPFHLDLQPCAHQPRSPKAFGQRLGDPSSGKGNLLGMKGGRIELHPDSQWEARRPRSRKARVVPEGQAVGRDASRTETFDHAIHGQGRELP